MPQNNHPLVSIVIPVYNGSNYMREAIDSALAQTYDNTEIIVVNDGSNDNGATEKIALSYGEQIRYIKKENGGVSSALNAGINAMKGEFFSWLSHDDKYLPEKIETQVNMILNCSCENVIGICGAKQINANSMEISSKKKKSVWDENNAGKVITWDDALLSLIDYGSFGGCTLLIPKQAFDKAGLFEETLRYSQDFLMWIRIFLAGFGLVRTPGIHVCSRVHANQLTQTGSKLFHHDSIIVGHLLIAPLCQYTTVEHNFIKSFALYNSKYNNPEVVEKCIKRGKDYKVLSHSDIIEIKAMLLYGNIRPIIRKAYYSVFRKIKTH